MAKKSNNENVTMEVANKAVASEEVKPSYEQLEKQVYNLAEKLNVMYLQLEEAHMFNTFKRLDYCFKVIEYKDAFDKSFVDYCLNDIVGIMTIKEEANAD